jgi:hypothetical protein
MRHQQFEMAEMIVGIRIGTKYTTYAWNNGTLQQPSFVCGQWSNPSTRNISVETPTVAVFNSRKKLKAFGFEAQVLAQEAGSENLLVFSDFIHQIFCNGTEVRTRVIFFNESCKLLSS